MVEPLTPTPTISAPGFPGTLSSTHHSGLSLDVEGAVTPLRQGSTFSVGASVSSKSGRSASLLSSSPVYVSSPSPTCVSAALEVTFEDQHRAVKNFLMNHKDACVLHYLLDVETQRAHSSVVQCDAISWIGLDVYKNFRQAFRRDKAYGARCNSCGCPNVDEIPHQQEFIGGKYVCRDELLQHWIIGLCFFTWRFTKLREAVFDLLGLSSQNLQFGRGLAGSGRFATWLNKSTGRSISQASSNLLDVLYIYATHSELVGTFDHKVMEREE